MLSRLSVRPSADGQLVASGAWQQRDGRGFPSGRASHRHATAPDARVGGDPGGSENLSLAARDDQGVDEARGGQDEGGAKQDPFRRSGRRVRGQVEVAGDRLEDRGDRRGDGSRENCSRHDHHPHDAARCAADANQADAGQGGQEPEIALGRDLVRVQAAREDRADGEEPESGFEPAGADEVDANECEVDAGVLGGGGEPHNPEEPADQYHFGGEECCKADGCIRRKHRSDQRYYHQPARRVLEAEVDVGVDLGDADEPGGYEGEEHGDDDHDAEG